MTNGRENKPVDQLNEHLAQVLEAIRNVNQLIVHETDPRRLIERACENLAHTLGYFNAWIALLDEEGESVTMTASAGFDGGFEKMRGRLERGEFPRCMREALASGSTVVVKNPPEDCRKCALSAQYQGRSGLARRLGVNGRAFGVLAVSVPAHFAENAEERSLFEELADDLSFGLKRLADSETLRRQEYLLKKSQEIAHVGSWELDLERNRLTWSDEVYRIFGLGPGEFRATYEAFLDAVHPDDRRRVDRAYRDSLREGGTAYQIEHRIVRPRTGEVRYVREECENIADDSGLIVRSVGMVQDITERKQAEEDLLEASLRQQMAVSAGNVGLWDWDLVTNKVSYSDEWKRQIGYGPDEIGDDFEEWQSRVHPEDLQPALDKVHWAIEQRLESYQCEFRFRHRDDSYRWILAQGSVITDEQDQPVRVLGSHVDITEQRKTENAYSRLCNLATELICIADLNTATFIQVNPAFTELLGYTETELREKPFLEFLHPDDVAPTWRVIEEELGRGKKVISFENRYRRRDGTYRWLDWNSHPFPEEGLIFAIAHDVTERKQKEEKLRESERKLREAQELAHLGHWSWDIATGNVEWSEQIFKLFNLDPQEFTPHIDAIQALSPWPEDHQRDKELIRRASESHEPGTYEQRFLYPDGSTGYFFSTFRGQYDENGRLVRIVGTAQDITERKQAEQRLREQQDLLNYIIAHDPNAIAVYDNQLRYIYVSRRYLDDYGVEEQDVIGKHHYEVFPEMPQKWKDVHRRVLAGAVERSEDDFFERPDGSITYNRWECRPWYQPDGSIGGMITYTEVTTERKQAEIRLRESEEKYRLLADNTLDVIWMMDMDLRFTYVNPAIERMFGYTPDEFIGTNLTDHCDEPHLQEMRQIVEQRLGRLGEPRGTIFRTVMRKKDGTPIDVEIHGSLLLDENSQPVGLQGTTRDITERKQAEAALRESEEKHRTYVENAPAGIFVVDEEGRYVDVNQAACDMTGYPREELLNMSVFQLASRADTDMQDSFEMLKRDGVVQVEGLMQIKGGEEICVSLKAVKLGEGRYMAFCADITDRKSAEEALQESERQKLLILNSTAEMVAYYDLDLRVIWANRASADSGGKTPEELVGMYCYEIWQGRDVPCENCPVIEAGATGVPQEREVRSPDGRHWHLRGYPVFDENNELIALVEFGQEITARKRAEEEKAQLEQQYFQAQKMEAIGQLTGGVAHDFNNLLQVIKAGTDIARTDLEADHPATDSLDEVARAADRAARLISQLLVFSRRQIMRPEPIDLNVVVADLFQMLERVIGEHVRLQWHPGEDVGMIHADRGMIEQALVNLCVNARDAMPGGGHLTIETDRFIADEEFCSSRSWARPGRFAMLEVSDTGCGMDEHVRAHMFEPFFTTKETGKGTGLGLATVYGIIKQHQGMIDVESEPGKGSRFRLFFPHHAEAMPEGMGKPAAAHEMTGRETVLLVEDDPAILKLGQRILDNLGYTTIAADSPAEAIRIAREHEGDIHLLLTDVVMPRMSGQELSRRISEIRPATKCLFMSGYTAETIVHEGILDEGLHLLQKPFTTEDMARAIRAVLDAGSTA